MQRLELSWDCTIITLAEHSLLQSHPSSKGEQSICEWDRTFEIKALRGEFTDALMMRDYDRFASLFTQDGAWRIPYVKAEFVSLEEIRARIELRAPAHADH
jgi:hypothetical protein